MSNPNPNTGEPLPLETAKQWVENYRIANPGSVESHFFGINTINQVLNQQPQPNIIGIRMYRAIDETNAPQIILVGVDSNQNDVGNDLLMDRSSPCPPCSGHKFYQS